MALEKWGLLETGRPGPWIWESSPSSWEDVSFCHNTKETFTWTLFFPPMFSFTFF